MQRCLEERLADPLRQARATRLATRQAEGRAATPPSRATYPAHEGAPAGRAAAAAARAEPWTAPHHTPYTPCPGARACQVSSGGDNATPSAASTLQK